MIRKLPVIPMIPHSNESLMKNISIVLVVFSYSLEKWNGSLFGWKLTASVTAFFVFIILVAVLHGMVLGYKIKKYKQSIDEKETTQMLNPDNKRYTKP